MSTLVYDKTDKGREEIATRKYQLASRVRTLLVMVDGKQTEDELLKKVVGLGLNQQNIDELLEQQFIAAISGVSAPAAASSFNKIQPQVATPQTAAANASATPAAATEENGPDSVLGLGEDGDAMDDAARFQAIHTFFNETIKSTLGLRGFTLQMKVERAATLEDFRELRRTYLEAVQKAKGNEMARSLRHRLDQLLYPGEKPPSDTTLMGP